MTTQDWASTTEDAYDMHRFDANRRARCNPEIRTYSRNTTPERDQHRWPHMRLRTREEIETSSFSHLYRFCSRCLSEETEVVSPT